MEKAIEMLARGLMFVPIAVIALIAAMILWLKWMINYVRFGGECIVYTDKNARKTIKDIYNILEKQHNETK